MKFYNITGKPYFNLGISINNKLQLFNLSFIFIDFLIYKDGNRVILQIMLQIPFYKLIGVGIIIE